MDLGQLLISPSFGLRTIGLIDSLGLEVAALGGGPGSGPQVTRTGSRPTAQGGADGPGSDYDTSRNQGKEGSLEGLLGNYSTVATPVLGELRKNRYLHHLDLSRMMFAREAELKEEIEALGALQKASVAAEGASARFDYLDYLVRQLKVSRHSSRLCGDRMVPTHGSRKDGTKYETGAPGHVRIDRYEGDRADYVWTRRCGSVWFCLGCASKIYAERRLELQQAFDYFQGKDKTYSFVTLTFPHTNKETLTDTMERLGQAVRSLRTGKAWTLFKQRYGLEHIIRATEVTYSEANGWHPHFHMLFIYDRKSISSADAQGIEDYLRDRWSRICIKYGFIASEQKRLDHLLRGVDVKTGLNPVDWEYMAKIKVWEMASTTTKTPRRLGHLSPWEVFELARSGVKKFRDLWWDFMTAMRGRAAIRWSPGLKQLVGIDEKTDNEIVKGKQAELVYIVDDGSFRKIVRRRSRVRVLEAVEAGFAGDVHQCSAVEDEFGLILVVGQPPGQLT